MAVETNFLSFKRGDGSWGDVKPRQNNFAGLGTTGGGVPGDSYPDIDTGVLAQIQHLVVYSGEHVDAPVGPRTKLKQDDILESIAHLKGRTTFADLSRRWASDRHYGAAIEWVAGKYRAGYCVNVAAATQAEAGAAALPDAAALGGPKAKDGDTATPPVRTIWSRSAQPAPKAALAPAPEQAAPKPEATPPAATGATEPAQAEAAQAEAAPKEPAKPLIVPTPVEVTPPPKAPASPALPAPVLQPAAAEESKAFAFAAAMVAASAAPAADAPRCRVFQASYGGTKTLLVRAQAGAEAQYTALTVLEGFEESMLASYVKAHAPGGDNLGTFDTREAALARAGELCSGPDRAAGASAG